MFRAVIFPPLPMTIDYLAHHPDLIAPLAQRCASEWAHLYLTWGEGEAVEEFRTARTDGGLPATLVALDEDGTLLGTVSVIEDDLPGFEHRNPWLASLLVLTEHRNKGVGAFLVREAERFARQAGCAELYLFTESADGLFRRLGWREMEKTTANGHEVRVFQRRLEA